MIFQELDSGKSVEGHPIAAFKTDVKHHRNLFLIGGTHGDEVEGIHVLKELFAWLKNETHLAELPMVVIPILNVDGYRASTRVNARQIDLNRNYPSKDWKGDFTEAKYNPGPKALSEPENQFLIKLFEKYPPGLILSFHTWKPILNYNGDCRDVAEFLASFNNYPIDSDIGYSTPGSLGTFAPERYDAPVLTFECPPITQTKNLKDIWLENEKGLKALFSHELLVEKLALEN
jgi:protein MpaA